MLSNAGSTATRACKRRNYCCKRSPRVICCVPSGHARTPRSRAWPHPWTIGVLTLFLLETCTLHTALRLRILHERLPDETCPRVFCHEHGDPRINPHHIRVVPILNRIESVYKSIAAPGFSITV